MPSILYFTKKGFTIIELLVVIAIIAVLAAVVIGNFSSYSVKSRDAKRKVDLRNIALALDMYYSINGTYPKVTIVLDETDPPRYYSPDDSNHTQCSTNMYYTCADGKWIDSLKGVSFGSKIPVDPINNDQGPWCWGGHTNKNTIYTYISDGVHYVLCSWMENTSDESTLQFNDVSNPWNPSEKLYADYNYSGYNYVIVR